MINFIRGMNYVRLAKRANRQSIKALDKALEYGFADPLRLEHEDRFVKLCKKRDELMLEAQELFMS